MEHMYVLPQRLKLCAVLHADWTCCQSTSANFLWLFVFVQGCAIYCPSGQFAELLQIQRWTSQTAYCRQVQGEQPEALDSHQSVCGSLLSPLHCPLQMCGRKNYFGFVHLDTFFFYTLLSLSLAFISGVFPRAHQHARTLKPLHSHSSLRLFSVLALASD